MRKTIRTTRNCPNAMLNISWYIIRNTISRINVTTVAIAKSDITNFMANANIEASGRQNLYIFAARVWWWDRRSRFIQIFEVEFDRFLDQLFDLVLGLANGHTSRQVRNISPIACFPFFDDDHISHNSNLYFFSNSLVQPV